MTTYCERQLAPKRAFDRRSFRWKASGKARVLIGCPAGKWQSHSERCAVSTRAYKVLVRARGRCRVGSRRITKR